MSIRHSNAKPPLTHDSARASVAASGRNDAFALPVLVAYVVLVLPVLVLRVLVIALWERLARRRSSAEGPEQGMS